MRELQRSDRQTSLVITKEDVGPSCNPAGALCQITCWTLALHFTDVRTGALRTEGWALRMVCILSLRADPAPVLAVAVSSTV